MDLTHIDAMGQARMVDVSAKPVTERTARAEALVVCSERAQELLRTGRLPKGDALAVARIAGIAGAKRTADLIPLCHPLALTGVEVSVEVGGPGVEIRTATRTADRTGVEMEALTAATIAALTVIDMIKGVDRSAYIEAVRWTAKSGGRSGTWVAAAATADNCPTANPSEQGATRSNHLGPARLAAVITISDRCTAGQRTDLSGPHLAQALTQAGWLADPVVVVPDEVIAIRTAVQTAADLGARVIVTTGGTGLGPRDVTPEALVPLFDRILPGVGETLRARGAATAAAAALSRTVAGVIDRTLIVALPGSLAAAQDGAAYLVPLLDHAISQLDGGDHTDCGADR
jgi:cyclic pyranopterin phosphate synthase